MSTSPSLQAVPSLPVRRTRRLLAVAVVVVALVVVAFAAVAMAVSASATKPFHLAKTCDGFTCVVTSSTYKGIPAGTTINYSGSGPAALVAVINGPHGSATGDCNIASVFATPSTAGTCTFNRGTGSFSAFQLTVAVTLDSTSVWHWDGTYSHGED